MRKGWRGALAWVSGHRGRIAMRPYTVVRGARRGAKPLCVSSHPQEWGIKGVEHVYEGNARPEVPDPPLAEGHRGCPDQGTGPTGIATSPCDHLGLKG